MLRIQIKAMYHYSLDKSSKKFICPRCHKKSFVKYFDNVNSGYLEDHLGRCDRETNCKYRLAPKQKCTITTIVITPVKLKVSTLNPELINQCKMNFKQNNLIQFLRTYFSDEEIEINLNDS